MGTNAPHGRAPHRRPSQSGGETVVRWRWKQLMVPARSHRSRGDRVEDAFIDVGTRRPGWGGVPGRSVHTGDANEAADAGRFAWLDREAGWEIRRSGRPTLRAPRHLEDTIPRGFHSARAAIGSASRVRALAPVGAVLRRTSAGSAPCCEALRRRAVSRLATRRQKMMSPGLRRLRAGRRPRRGCRRPPSRCDAPSRRQVRLVGLDLRRRRRVLAVEARRQPHLGSPTSRARRPRWRR